ncbi:MAG: DNA replication and repair protein recF [uncultured bacterium]|nr:MAG: DNA replication and repair protein recF [uncultured bacterium]
MIKTLNLINFRNFIKKEIEFSDGVNVINAPNASGKTNILEAIFMLSLGKSFKTRKVDECIKYGEQIARVTIDGLEIVITKDVAGWPKKRLLVNGVPRRLVDFTGNIKTVLFAPQDLELITDGPALRRNFLDNVLCITDREYRRSLLSYEKGIRQRNRLLLRIREEGISRSNLLFWNQLLIKNGTYISGKRRELIEFINSLGKCNLKYDYSAISEGRLEQYKNEEIASATTLVGPHRDDFIFLQESRDLARYGSRGQQRMEILWLKLAELAYIEEVTEVKPILLLDDIFSELDHMHREIVMQTLKDHQVIITSVDEHNIGQLRIKKEEIRMINL